VTIENQYSSDDLVTANMDQIGKKLAGYGPPPPSDSIDWSNMGGFGGNQATPDSQKINPAFQNPDGSINRGSPHLRANQMESLGNTGTGGGGGGSNFFADIYDNLAQSTRDLFGEIEHKDFTSEIQSLAEQGRIDIEEMNEEQLTFLQDAFDRRISQINEIGSDLTSELRVLDTAGSQELDSIAQAGVDRRGQAAIDEASRVSAQRAELGQQVSSEFEEVVALTEGLRSSTAESSAAAMDRLRTVSRMASQERLAMPAKLMAQAQMAVGDEKFRLENQIKQTTSDALRQLNAREREQVLGEAQRLAQQGYAQDMAMAQALMQIEGQRTQTYIQEEQRRRAQAAAAAAARAKAESKQRDDQLAASLLGIPPEMYKVMPSELKTELWENAYSPEKAQEQMSQMRSDQMNSAIAGVSMGTWQAMEDWQQQDLLKEVTESSEYQPPAAVNTLEGLTDLGWSSSDASLALANRAKKDAYTEALARYGDNEHAEVVKAKADLDRFNLERGLTQTDATGNSSVTASGQRILSAVDYLDQIAPYQTGGLQDTMVDGLNVPLWQEGGAMLPPPNLNYPFGNQQVYQAFDKMVTQ
jgi:hypothetical protein